MWCDNCLLLFPLRWGAMVWAGLIIVYSAVGGIFMFKYGLFIYFRQYEAQAFGGIAMAIAGIALLNIFALANSSWTFTRACKFFWPFVVVISAIRAILMIVDINNNRWKIQYECDHGGVLYGATADQYVGGKIPCFDTSICKYGVSSLYTGVIFGVLLDLGFQIYMLFLNWRFVTKLDEKYSGLYGPAPGGYYNSNLEEP